MNVFFDVDDTIMSSQSGSLRPLVSEVFRELVADGHRIYIWSAVGIRWAALDRHGLREYVTECYPKPIAKYRESLAALGIAADPEFVVDDYPELVAEFGGYQIPPYVLDDPADREMATVLSRVRAVHRNGAPDPR
jgi:hypothetical protein